MNRSFQIYFCVMALVVLACSKPPVQPIERTNEYRTLTGPEPKNIEFEKQIFSFQFDPLDYGTYAQATRQDRGLFEEKCHAVYIKIEELKSLMIDAEPISLSEGRHDFDRGMDHCSLDVPVTIEKKDYRLSLSIFGIGRISPMSSENEDEDQYFLARNCDHSREYIKWYFKKTGHYPGAHEFETAEEMLGFFCDRVTKP